VGLLLNCLSQLSITVIVDLAITLLLFGVVAFFYAEKHSNGLWCWKYQLFHLQYSDYV